MTGENSIKNLRERASDEKKIVREMIYLLKDLKRVDNVEEANLIASQIAYLKSNIKKISKDIVRNLEFLVIARPFSTESPAEVKEEKLKIQPLIRTKFSMESLNLLDIEKETLRRLKKKREKVTKKKLRKPSKYIKISNRMFSDFSASLASKKMFKNLKKDLIKANMQLIPPSYISVILLTTMLSIVFSFFLIIFLLFFNVGVDFPFITRVGGSILSRFLKVSWLFIAIPVGTFFFMNYYPNIEKKSRGNKINYELPFATIHMSAIAGSMIDPSKIFNIILLTKEYPNIETEFIKLINEINIYGYDLVTALKHVSSNTPSKKLAELLDGLSTTITSGGNLPEFFNKRAESLLFQYRIEKEKRTKSAETFMDVYISVVIAAPMILMLLLMMMKISGIGLAISSAMITLIMVLGVAMVNVLFLTFLHLKQPPA
ncbi:flagellar assembly protein J [archaeon BMS3Abin17]|nr:flagellar assembly protein J [archaeon BMS3Abin17]HDZ61399.1 hypothetical protein [Candidatus Pacearchaeota archaeon]